MAEMYFLGSSVENIFINKAGKTSNFNFLNPKDDSRLKPLKKGTKSSCFKDCSAGFDRWHETGSMWEVLSPRF